MRSVVAHLVSCVTFGVVNDPVYVHTDAAVTEFTLVTVRSGAGLFT